MPAPLKFQLKDIESVTNNFADANFIGEGRIGKVYSGRLSLSGEVTDVAVRRLDHSFWLQDIAFDKEIAFLSALKHKNLVSNVGFCNENDEMLIINKHEANGCLYRHLSGPTLTWMRRLQISVGVASALNYLHGDGRRNFSVIHRDVSSRSILLDENWEAKLSGFEYSLRIPVGNPYVAYEKLGMGSYKTDVFSLGIVLFEILCGSEAFISKDDNSFQAPLAIFHYENGTLHELVDPDLNSQMDRQAFRFFSLTAYHCLKEQRTPPKMNLVLQTLEKALKFQQNYERQDHSTITPEPKLPDHLMLKLKNFEHMRIQFTDIVSATMNFGSKNLIVSGGYGEVYKGKLHHDDRGFCFATEGENECEVAIKHIMDLENEIAQEGFYAEIEMLTLCKHSNIITLLGFCNGILVYEYAPNKSLSDYLINKTKIYNDSWTQRVKICLGVAKGLSCLHANEGGRQDIVHRDIKSGNILLGNELDAKIGDFGLSTFLSVDEGHKTRYSLEILGTSLYLDPQYVKDGKLKKELDVYSFGVVMFEILSGRLANDPFFSAKNNKSLVLMARQHFENKAVMEMVDQKIKEATTETIFTSIEGPAQDSIDTFSKVAYQCLEERRSDRPKMGEVIKELQKALFFQENRKDIYKIPLEKINVATKNLSVENLIGEGGYGMVYIGKVSHASGNTSIAVKRWNTHYQFGEDEFYRELKILMEHSNHENVISLLGYCDEMNEKIMVFEYASNGSLDEYIKHVNLTCRKRLEICIDIATALDFLHGAGEEVVIHRDIKSSNILLDADMKAKISDFELSIILGKNQEMVENMEIAGTRTYIDPEYVKTGLLSKECDIYSFGIVLFEIMFQRLAFESIKGDNDHLGPLIKRQYKQGKLDELMFEGTNEVIVPQALTIFKRIAIQCLRDNRQERPTAGEVVFQLSNALEIQEKGIDIVRISLEDIKSATDNFNDHNCIGSGGYGKIYKGEILHANEHRIIAAKRFVRDLDHADREFNREVEILLKFKHKNVISLEGYCDEDDERITVYEYASQGSLDRCLDSVYLTWKKRLEILIDVASGLDFLHGGFLRREAVIHRDIKSANILLNHDGKAKISDFGISLLSPINQEMDYDLINDNNMITGTLGYIDPSYIHTGFLSKQSDIYSFGVVLFELLCGRLLMEHRDGTFKSLVPFVKRCYEEGKLDEMVFHAMREQIDPSSLTAFVDIAIQCINELGEKRPKAGDVVIQLKKALEFQEDYEMWEPELPHDYKEIIQQSETPEIYINKKKKDLYDMFFKGILIQEGKVWFSLDSYKKRREMVSATLFSYKNQRSKKLRRIRKSRFERVAMMLDLSNLKIQIQIKAQFLSPNIIYGVYLVFKLVEPKKNASKPMYVSLKYKKENETLQAYFASWRDEEWMMIELYRFFSYNEVGDVDVLLESFSRYYCRSHAVYVEGIEFRAIDNVKIQKIDKLEDVQQVRRSNSNVDQMQQFPPDYEEISERFANHNEDEKLFQQSEVNIKKHHMLSAKEVLYDSSNVKLFYSKPSEQSRFQEVTELQSQQVFRIKCKIEKQMLSPDTDYMCYLVFKLSEKCHELHCPVKVRDLLHRNNKETGVFYFRAPRPGNIHDITRVPKQREDGWMEVKIWEFNSNSALNNEYVPLNLKLISYEGTMSGLIICGLELRPM